MIFRSLAAAAVLAIPLAFAAEEPEAVFAKFHRAVLAGDFDEMWRHSTAASVAEAKAMSPAARRASLGLVQRITPMSYAVAGKRFNPHGEGMILRLAVPGSLGSGAARLVLEDDEWKVDRVIWGSSNFEAEIR